MKLHGSVEANLTAAIHSARRLRGRAVYPETISHWARVIEHARREPLASDEDADPVLVGLISDLETEIAERQG